MPKPNRHIWLCGFMGCGKSTVGPLLSKRCGIGFIDLDRAIEEGECMRIPDIFSRLGEAHFRALESAYIAKLGALSPAVIAAGGGAFLSADNAAEAKKNGVIVFLDVPFETCYTRIAASDRPIVRQNSKEALRQIYEKRHVVYRQHADLRISGVFSPSETARQISQKFANFV